MAKQYTTKSKTQILEYVKNRHDKRFTAQEVHDHLSAEDLKINLATVYRNLDRLADEGLLLRYKSMDMSSTAYQYVEQDQDCHNHLHLQCKDCGRIIHLECDFMHEIEEHLQAHHGFSIACKESVIVGLCADCQKKA